MEICANIQTDVKNWQMYDVVRTNTRKKKNNDRMTTVNTTSIFYVHNEIIGNCKGLCHADEYQYTTRTITMTTGTNLSNIHS